MTGVPWARLAATATPGRSARARLEVSWASLPSRREPSGSAHDNRAHSGSLCTETALLVASSAPPPASVFVLMTGLNDARLNGGAAAQARAAYAEALEVVFRAFRQASPEALVLALEQPYIGDYAGYAPFHRASDGAIDAYNATLRGAASRYQFARVVAIEGWQLNTMIATDGVHPNDHGHRHLAQAVVTAWSVVSRHTHRPGG